MVVVKLLCKFFVHVAIKHHDHTTPTSMLVQHSSQPVSQELTAQQKMVRHSFGGRAALQAELFSMPTQCPSRPSGRATCGLVNALCVFCVPNTLDKGLPLTQILCEISHGVKTSRKISGLCCMTSKHSLNKAMQPCPQILFMILFHCYPGKYVG